MSDRYNLPEDGADDWDVPVNENFAALEVDVELRGAGAPGDNGVEPVAGQKYLDTDTGAVYISDGSTWTLLVDPTRPSIVEASGSDPTDVNIWIRTDIEGS